ncbi:MAG: hypothetical protein JXB15_00845 [Anaerolineales bacterium]|nr:hypothetical protein [Anaerolineales bacterium]
MNPRKPLWITMLVALALLVAPLQAQSAGITAAPGSLDTSFSADGKTTGGWAAYNDGANAVAIQRDGKIVMAGYTEYSDGDEDFLVLRYNPDGTLDSSFGFMGMVVTPFNSTYTDRANAVAIQPDGKILAAGYVYPDGPAAIAVARYNSNGSLDNTFDGDGMVVINIGNNEDVAEALVLQPDGKILLVGHSIISKLIIALARLNSNGSLDTTFDYDGIVTTDLGTATLYDYGMAAALQSDGKILVAGYSATYSSENITLVRYNTDGSLDTSFNGDGIVMADLSVYDEALGLAIQPDGKIVVGGITVVLSGHDFLIARYHIDGSLDTSFGFNGFNTADMCGESESLSAIAIQPDGNILAAGTCFSSPNHDFILARFNSNGELDASFDGDGKTLTNFLGCDDHGNAVAIQPDGKIIVAGESMFDSKFDVALARYWGNSYLYLPALRK